MQIYSLPFCVFLNFLLYVLLNPVALLATNIISFTIHVKLLSESCCSQIKEEKEIKSFSCVSCYLSDVTSTVTTCPHPSPDKNKRIPRMCM